LNTRHSRQELQRQQLQQQQDLTDTDRSEGKRSSPFAPHALNSLCDSTDSSSKHGKCGATGHHHSNTCDRFEDDNVPEATENATENQIYLSSSTSSITTAWPTQSVSRPDRVRGSEYSSSATDYNNSEVAMQDHQHSQLHDHSQLDLLPQPAPSVLGPQHNLLEPSMRLPSSFSFSLTDLYPEAPAGASSTAADPPPAPHELRGLMLQLHQHLAQVTILKS